MRRTPYILALALVACSPEVQTTEAPCTVEQTAGGARMTCPNGESFLFRDAPQGQNAQSFAYLVQTAEVEPGQTCPHGGLLVRVGRDDDSDGRLDDDEEVTREAVCRGGEGADGAQVLVERATIARGEVCPDGGSRLRVGTDADRDGALADDEVELTSDLCFPSTNACTPDHIVFDDGECVPLYAMDLEAVVTATTLTGASALPFVAVGDAVQGTLVYPWERDDYFFNVEDSGRRRSLTYDYEPGEIEMTWTLGGASFAGASSGTFFVGQFAGDALGARLSTGAALDPDGAISGVSSIFFNAYTPPSVTNLDSFRPPSPEFLDSVAPFELRLGDAVAGELTIEVRRVTRRADVP
jgi:hypothetical protein